MNDLITVIVPVYNGEKYIERCIKSIINQTYKKLENVDTKMWYYSDETLAEFFINEYDRRELYGV